jgi:hypothetical protein
MTMLTLSVIGALLRRKMVNAGRPEGKHDELQKVLDRGAAVGPCPTPEDIAKAPEGFPFPTAIKSMWTVLYFEAQGEKATRVRGVCLGFTDDDESRKMREFFNRGNTITLQKLQKRFEVKADAK